MERVNGNFYGVFWDFLYPATILGLGVAATAAVIIQIGGL